MRRSRCQGRAQLLLALEPQSLRALPASNPSGLLEALAELLLEAAGAAGPLKTGGADEQQDHR
jgi:hypothetical protein